MPVPLVARAIDALRDEDFATARDCIADYEEQNPLEIQHYLIRGLAELALNNWSAAAATFAAAIMRYPDDTQLYFNLGVARENLGALINAAADYERSIALKNDQADAYGNLANVYYKLARFPEAAKMACRAIELGAPRAQALNSLGMALDKLNRRAEAAAAFEESLKLKPDDVSVLCNYANLAVDQFDFEQAWTRFARARAIGDAAFVRHHEGMARLLAGDYAEGWKLYETRLEMKGGLRVRPPCPRYHREDLAGKTLVFIAEQGFGDVIHFCRYGKLLEKKGTSLVWVVPKNLQRLLADNVPGRVVSEGETLPSADYYLPILSMPLALGLFDPKDAPAAPYMKAAASPALPDGAGKRKIGLVWTGSKTHERDHERSIPLTQLLPLLEKIPAQFYAPFIGAGLEQADGLPIVRLDHLIKDFAYTAALISQLDCLISVDTAAAHLAGALGIKTYLLLPHCPDWRWGYEGYTTAWYANMMLLRQPEPGDWVEPIKRLAELLTEKV